MNARQTLIFIFVLTAILGLAMVPVAYQLGTKSSTCTTEG